MNEDEKKLIEISKNFRKFLEAGPKIGYNLHKALRKIQSEFEYVLKFI